jgi:hypothetical protein
MASDSCEGLQPGPHGDMQKFNPQGVVIPVMVMLAAGTA